MAARLRFAVLSGGLAMLLLFSGCGGQNAGKPAEGNAEPDLGPKIGSVAEIIKAKDTPVEGYGLVVGLSGTGSAMCPPAIRSYLKQYILSQIPDTRTNLDELINSRDTAVVYLEGTITAMAMKGDRFDVRVSPVAGSDTTSLCGGRLYLAELKPLHTFGIDARVLATVEGPVFVDLLGSADPAVRTGYILGGGRALLDYSGIIHLRRANYLTASAIRNRVNERYGPDVATAVSDADIQFRIPAEYRLRKERFISLLGATYLSTTADATNARIDAGLRGLVDGNDRDASEISLETLGRTCIAGLIPLLKSPNEEVRFRAARCMLYLHDDRALETLQAIAVDPRSSRRVEAVETIALGARPEDAGAILRPLLSDKDERVVRTVLDQSRRLGDPAVQEDLVSGDFYLDRVPQATQRAILVSRSGAPRIALLGAQLACRDSMSIESPGGFVAITAKPGENTALIVRKSLTRGRPAPSARSSLAVSDIVLTLGGPRMGVSYAEIVALLQRMRATGAIDVQFWPGPLPKFEQPVKK